MKLWNMVVVERKGRRDVREERKRLEEGDVERKEQRKRDEEGKRERVKNDNIYNDYFLTIIYIWDLVKEENDQRKRERVKKERVH